MIRTYFDAGALIAAVRGEKSLSQRARDAIRDPDRLILASTFLRLEVEPKARYHRNLSEIAFYDEFFAQATDWAEPIERIVEQAHREAAQHGLNALDALHVAAAVLLGADELVTTEGPRKPIHRVTGVKIVTLAGQPR